MRCLLGALVAGPVATPAIAQMLVGDGTVTCGTPYVVAGGDTLSRIAARAYGDPQLYGFLADANWEALGGNPESIAAGMSLTIPCVDATGATMTADQVAKETARSAASLKEVVAVEGTLTPAELDTLFGPVALFPDKVLTPVLVASTFPLDVVKAARFVDETSELSDKERAAQAAKQDWDSSVRELAAGFPTLLTRMSDNIDWTEQAGEAVVAQTDDVLAALQRLRGKAQTNGYLVDNEAQKVETVNDKIVIASANPDVVYVPTYDSQVVYTTPVVGPPVYHYGYEDNYDWSDALVTGGIILGGAVILDEIFDDDDWDGWDGDDDIDWDRGDITIDRGDINIDRDRVNIDGGDRVAIGDGNRPGAGNGISIGNSDRPQVDREALAGARDRVGAAGRPGAGALAGAAAGVAAGAAAGSRRPISSSASRDAARKKIETRKATGAAPAKLKPARAQTTRGTAATSRARSPAKAANRAAPSRPAAQRVPKARAPSHASAFQRSSGGSRAAAAGSRGHSSMSRGGGSRGGGRGGGRGR